jgi:urease accessory protein
MNARVAPETGWKAQLCLGYEARQGKTKLVERTQRGPLAVQRPLYPEGAPCHTYLLHPPGGVVGGDQLDIQVSVAEGAHTLITTPGATKFYRSEGKWAYQQQTLNVANGGTLEWFPQENIAFPGAHGKIHTRIELGVDSRFMGWEIQCLGRPAIDEVFDHGHLHTGLEVLIDDRLVLLDHLITDGDSMVKAAAGLKGHAMAATFIVGPIPEAHLDTARAVLETFDPTIPVGATWMDNLLVIRMLGDNSEHIQQVLIPVWKALRSQWWNIEPCPPRIWAT